MIHSVLLALCIASALTVVFFALWTFIGNKLDAGGGIFAGHALARRNERYLVSGRGSGPVEFRTASDRGFSGGWSLIHRSIRARRDIRLAVR
ncbi:MAG TPA: hypothetical protein VII70_03725 [Steroidobacteraceae bacterium]